MRIFKKTKAASAWARPRSGSGDPYAALREAQCWQGESAALYRSIRREVPIVDAAIGKVVRLCGGFTVRCGDQAAERALNRFLNTVDVGWGQRGLQSFLDCYLDSMLTCGRAAGEILLDGEGREIRAVVCREADTLRVLTGETPADVRYRTVVDGKEQDVQYPALILFTPFNPETDHPLGVSMLRSMPRLAGTLMTIYNSIRANYERSGQLRYAVSYRPGSDPLDRVNAAENMERLAQEWSRSMRATREGSVCDFVTMGDVDIRTIGADADIPETEAPVRQILEQLVSKTGVPPFLLGLSWSSTERMSSQQADMMTSEIWAIRRSLTPVVERICELFLALRGVRTELTVVWDNINLQDLAEEARARLYDAQAAEIEQKIGEETTV